MSKIALKLRSMKEKRDYLSQQIEKLEAETFSKTELAFVFDFVKESEDDKYDFNNESDNYTVESKCVELLSKFDENQLTTIRKFVKLVKALEDDIEESGRDRG